MRGLRKTNDMPDAPTASPLYRDHIKRAVDIAIAVPVLAAASVPMAVTAAAIKLDSPGPVIFRQQRIGLHGNTFDMLKFRSMYVNSEYTGSGVYSDRDDERVTRVGRIIRATSIDELPQLINVLKGEMSLIGPRPPLTYHPWPLEEYTEEQRHMFDVRPGFSGWAQMNGRRWVEWPHRIELNNWYVDHVTFSLDARIFFKTIAIMLSGNKGNENVGETVESNKQSV